MKVLSFDGGGVLGIGPAHFLELRERDNGKPISQEFNGFSGTSTGSIIAAGLAVGFSATQIVFKYKKHVPHIFKKRPWWKRGLTGATYDIQNLNKAMISIFGNIKFKDLNKHLLIAVSDFKGNDSKLGPCSFYSKQTVPEMTIADAVTRSCAASTYFKPVLNRFVDGGLFANNPSMAMITHLRRLGVLREKISMLSFATTGINFKSKDPDPMNPISLAKNIINFMLESASARVIHKYCKHSDLKKYSRIGPKINGPKMDNIDSMSEWSTVWAKLYQKTSKSVFS